MEHGTPTHLHPECDVNTPKLVWKPTETRDSECDDHIIKNGLGAMTEELFFFGSEFTGPMDTPGIERYSNGISG